MELIGDSNSAVIEIAAASGITLVPPEKTNPLIATTYCTGGLIMEALDYSCHRLIIGVCSRRGL